MKKIAWIITRVFDPVLEIPLAVCMTIGYAVVSDLWLKIGTVLIFFYVLVPAVYFVMRIKRGKVSDWDVSKREERKAIYEFCVASHFLGILAAAVFGQFLLVKILLVLWLVSVIFMIVNVYWKISVHAGVNMLVVVLLNNFWGWRVSGWLIMVLLVVMWSRIVLKKHSVTQVVAGAAVAFILVEVGLRVIGV